MSLFRQLTSPISGVRFVDPPARVELNESFDLVVETQSADPAEGSEGEPITFTLDGEFWMETTGANIDPNDDGTAFDGLVGVQFEEPGYYDIGVNVAGNTATHTLAVGVPVGEEPEPSSINRQTLAAVGALGAVAVGTGIIGGGGD